MVAVKLVKKAVIELNKLAKKEVDVAADPEALVKNRDDILVVAKVLVPSTIDRPEVVALPVTSTVKAVFSTQLDPFQ